MKRNSAVLSGLVAGFLISGCGTSNRAVKLGDDLSSPNIHIGYFSNFDPKVFAKLHRDGLGWKVIELSSTALTATHEGEEVIVLDRTETRLKPGYTGDFSQFNKNGELIWFDCSEVLSSTFKSGYLYSGCSKSVFNKVDVAATVAKNAVAVPLTLGLAAGTKRKVDTEIMEQALKASNAYALMKNYNNILSTWDSGRRGLYGEVERLKSKARESLKVYGGTLVPAGARATPELKIEDLRDKSEAIIPPLLADGNAITLEKLAAYRQRILSRLENQRNGYYVKVSCAPKAGGFDFSCTPSEIKLGLVDTPPSITAKVTDNKDYLAEAERKRQQQAAWQKREVQLVIQDTDKPRDASGRKIVQGPVSGGYWDNVRIVSSSIGVDSSHQSTTVRNSVIDADVCLVVGMAGAEISNTEFNCRVCVVRDSPPLGNVLMNNRLNCGH